MSFDYKIVRSSRSSLSIQITPKRTVIVKAPRLVPEFFIRKFVESKSDWIIKTLKKISPTLSHAQGPLKAGDILLYLGSPYSLVISDVKQITISDKFYFPNYLKFRLQKEIESWYIREAKRIITARVEHYSRLMDKKYISISYSDTISKWGSCAPDNRLQFNWRLVMAPMLVIDYVVVHELAHTTEKNHGPRFWKLVESYKPAHKQYRKWLKDNSFRLHVI